MGHELAHLREEAGVDADDGEVSRREA